MSRPAKIVALVGLLAVAPATAVAAAHTWRTLPAPPRALSLGVTGVWTGQRLVLLGRKPLGDTPSPARDVSLSYDPASRRWTVLSPPRGPESLPGYKTLWTGREMLAFDPFHSVAYRPATNTWRVLRKSIDLGLVAWTGREAIGWGGGCCGDASAAGVAYDPVSDRYRDLPPSPLSPSQGPIGAWTGRELILFVSGYSPDGTRYPARFARAAAYDPATNRWRRLAPFPELGERMGTAVWDGHELLVVAAGPSSRSTYAFDPATNHWRMLAPLPASRLGPLAVWTGRKLVVLGGENATATKELHDGLALDPRTNRWSSVPAAPLPHLYGTAAVWTGRTLIVSDGRRVASFTP